MVLETSPHTRGERSVPTPFQGSFGNIPAYAGRTQLLTLLLALRGKHPRIRGENDCAGLKRRMEPETSPHTRGEQLLNLKSLAEIGNIPAYAGRTTALFTMSTSSWKHPRIRGENSSRETILRELHRNIPAYAGRTQLFANSFVAIQKHPRIRGENLRHRLPLRLLSETSPHTRGEQVIMTLTTTNERNIPAYAGRTACACASWRTSWKHPRIRGENTLISCWSVQTLETSPHTRGELLI